MHNLGLLQIDLGEMGLLLDDEEPLIVLVHIVDLDYVGVVLWVRCVERTRCLRISISFAAASSVADSSARRPLIATI